MVFDYLLICVPVLGLIANVFFQVLSFKMIKTLGLLKSEYTGFIAGFFGVIIIEYQLAHSVSFGDFIATLIANLMVYSCLGFLYFTLVNLGETARRVRILREIDDSRGGLSIEELLERYNARAIIEKRIKRLVGNGQIKIQNDKYYINNPTMLWIARGIVLLKLVVIGKESEFS